MHPEFVSRGEYESYGVSGAGPRNRHFGIFKDSGKGMDWVLVGAFIPLLLIGLLTMSSFTGSGGSYFIKQLIWISVSVIIFFVVSRVDFRFLRTTYASVALFVLSCLSLGAVALIGKVAKGAQSWFDLGLFSIQPVDPVKLAIIIILAKYFSRRHIEIANFRHILVSGAYALIIFILVALQPDFGSAMIIFLLWAGMVLVSGIKKKHVVAVFAVGVISFVLLWAFAFKDYQKNRIRTFMNPLADVHGTGYNVNQSIIAVGSGQAWGKGIGYGTQSRLKFLPEYQTDFIAAAFSEEWGFFGFLIFCALYVTVVWRVIIHAIRGATNFEILFASGFAIYLVAHFIINVGMNLGLVPVTGIALPFLSYGGTHILTELIGLGMIVAMRRYGKVAHGKGGGEEFQIT